MHWTKLEATGYWLLDLGQPGPSVNCQSLIATSHTKPPASSQFLILTTNQGCGLRHKAQTAMRPFGSGSGSGAPFPKDEVLAARTRTASA
jgi:hypothetical protein